MKKGIWLAWCQLELQKLSGISRDGENRRCPLCNNDENEKHTVPKFNGTQK
jgi:hypothetical protein